MRDIKKCKNCHKSLKDIEEELCYNCLMKINSQTVHCCKYTDPSYDLFKLGEIMLKREKGNNKNYTLLDIVNYAVMIRKRLDYKLGEL